MLTNIQSDKPRLLIIGARGFVGSAVSILAVPTHHLLRADRTLSGTETDLVIDLANPAQIASVLREQRPDQVLLFAAIPDIDRCEREPNEAIAINLRGPEHVANTCAQIGARLLFTSTGAVFNGKKIGYYESDPVSPVSVYGKTKADAEQSILALLPSAIILRLSLVLGRSVHAGNSLLDSLIRRCSAGIQVRAPKHEYRNPIDLLTLSNWILELLANPASSGILHAGATEVASRYEIASTLANRLGFAAGLVFPDEDPPPPGRAPRGPHQHLFSTRIPLLCPTPIPDFQKVIAQSLHEFS